MVIIDSDSRFSFLWVLQFPNLCLLQHSIRDESQASCMHLARRKWMFLLSFRAIRAFVCVSQKAKKRKPVNLQALFPIFYVSRPCSRRIGPNFRHLQVTNLMVSTNRDFRLLASCVSWSDCGDDDHPVCLSFRAIPPHSKSVRKQEACQSSRNNSCCVSCLRNRSICASRHGLGSQLLPRLGNRWSNGWCPATRSQSSPLFLWPGPTAGYPRHGRCGKAMSKQGVQRYSR